MGLRMFLRDWKEFAAKTEFGIVLAYFCKIGVGHRKTFFVRREERRENGLLKILSKKANARKVVGLEIFCPSEKGEGE